MPKPTTLLQFTIDTSPSPEVFFYRLFRVFADEIIAIAEGDRDKPDADHGGTLLFLRGGGMVAVLERYEDVSTAWADRTALVVVAEKPW